jgi:hypothetical protein
MSWKDMRLRALHTAPVELRARPQPDSARVDARS